MDVLINFAANSHVDECYKDPVGTTRNNVIGMLKLLEAVRDYGNLVRFVHISTDEVYGDSEDCERPKKETDPLTPTNPYSVINQSASNDTSHRNPTEGKQGGL